VAQEYALVVDTMACVGCHACEVACKQENDLPVGPSWIRVHQDSSWDMEGKPQLRYLVTHCMHCRRPRCLEACPEGAITKRDDGVVLINAEACSGCMMCIEACPFGVIQFDEERGVAQKCTLCVQRLEAGRQPACVGACLSHCIYSGAPAEIAEKIGESRVWVW
jgi:Fe-S-cluster-containing dehydrogenase component